MQSQTKAVHIQTLCAKGLAMAICW